MGTASNGEIIKAATGSGGGASTGIAVLGMLTAPIVDALYTSATIVHTMDIPAGTIKPGDFVQAYILATKNGVVASTTLTVRIGTTGTASDVSLFSRASIATANFNSTVNVAFQAVSNTSLSMTNTPDIDGLGSSATANEAHKTVPDLSTNATKLTFALQNATDLTGIKAIVVTIARPGGSLTATALTGAQIVALLDAQLGGSTWQAGGGGGTDRYGDLTGGVWKVVPTVFRLRMAGTGTVSVDVRNKAGSITTGVAVYTVSGSERIEWQPSWSAENITEIRVNFTGSATAEVI